jgi:hypothetical protein
MANVQGLTEQALGDAYGSHEEGEA